MRRNQRRYDDPGDRILAILFFSPFAYVCGDGWIGVFTLWISMFILYLIINPVSFKKPKKKVISDEPSPHYIKLNDKTLSDEERDKLMVEEAKAHILNYTDYREAWSVMYNLYPKLETSSNEIHKLEGQMKYYVSFDSQKRCIYLVRVHFARVTIPPKEVYVYRCPTSKNPKAEPTYTYTNKIVFKEKIFDYDRVVK